MSHRSGSPYRIAWRKFRRNKLAMFAAGWITLCSLVAVFAYAIIPDKTTHANQQMVEAKLKKPGFRISVLKIKGSRSDEQRGWFGRLLQGKLATHRHVPVTGYSISDDRILVKHYMGEDDAAFDESYLLTEVVGITDTSERAGINHETIERDHIAQHRFLLGTDALGRDMLSRLLLGSRVSLSVGVVGVTISLAIGIVLGLLAGWFRGRLDDFIMFFSQVFWAIPTLLLALSLSLVMGNGLWQVFLAIGLTMWVDVARIVRGQVLLTRELPFVQAGKALGLGQARIVLKHILPNIMGPVLVVMAANFAAAVLLEAGLSFLGLGVPPPTPSWGLMLSEHRNYLVAGLPHLALLPGAAICLLVLSFFTISNGLRDAFDVRSR